MLEHFVARNQHYDEVVIPGLRGMGAAGPEDCKLMGAWNATAAQLLAAAEDLHELMRDARTHAKRCRGCDARTQRNISESP